jgi:hypothetical protein
MREDRDVYNPRDYLKFLHTDVEISEKARQDSVAADDRKMPQHSRFLSDVSDSSISTIRPTTNTSDDTTVPVTSTLGDYSANLAKFIQAQLTSIPSFQQPQLPLSPSSCPDLSHMQTPPQSPTKSIRRPADAPRTISIPPIRPPMRSAFSEWSSTDDEDDERSLLEYNMTTVKINTPAVLPYYQNSNDSSFLFTSTPHEDEDSPNTAKAFCFPNQKELPGSTTDIHSPLHKKNDDASSVSSTRPQLTPSSAPSFSSVSTGEYFDFRLNAQMKARIVAAVTPPQIPRKTIPAISPFEPAFSNTHSVLIENEHRLRVDGMSFDMLGDFNASAGGMRRVQTPC